MNGIFELIKTLSVPLSWLAPVVGLWLLIDSWFFAPRRRIERGLDSPDPTVLRIAYAVLPYLVFAVIALSSASGASL